jgi:multidrug resistance efflux pump/predicted small secreted protein
MKNKQILAIIITLAAALLLAACGAANRAAGQPTPTAVPLAVAEGSTVVDGRLVPHESVELAFDTTGEVAEVLVKEGDVVKAGDVLARLGNREALESSLAAAHLEESSAHLDQLSAENDLKALNDTLPEDRTAALAALTTARDDLRDTERWYRSTLNPATQADINEAQASLVLAKDVYEKALKDYEPYEKRSTDNLGRAAMLNRLADAERKYKAAERRYNGLVAGSNVFDVSQAKAEYEIAQQRLDQAQKRVDLLANGPDPDQVALIQARIDTAKARIMAAQTSIAAAEASLKDLELKATIAGTVVKLDLIPGQRVSPGNVVIQLADFSQWYVETDNLTEIDVVNISNGQAASVAPDALPALTLEATVDRISDVFEEKRGDVTYTARLLVSQADPRLRWGMTVVVNFK